MTTVHPSKPILVTMGDPAGIGPEIIMRAHQQGALDGCVVVGDVGVMKRAADLVGVTTLPEVLQPDNLPSSLDRLSYGVVHAEAGLAAAGCVTHAAWAALRGEVAAIVTAPLNKQGLAAAGLSWPGHTEMLQSLAATHAGHEVPVRMMLANEELRVVLVTIHASLRRAIDALSTAGVLETIVIAHDALSTAGSAPPRIAVAGLNPHAGEGGLFGDEEIHVIAPAVAQAKALGIDVHGPLAPDTVFMRARRGAFDVVVAMTHDHGLIPVKYLGVENGVNVTLGLPFVRSSPDHGTAYDIAGQGVADASSMIAALRYVRNRLAPVDRS